MTDRRTLQPQQRPCLNAAVAKDADCNIAKEVACRDSLRITTSLDKLIDANLELFSDTACECSQVEPWGETLFQWLKSTEFFHKITASKNPLIKSLWFLRNVLAAAATESSADQFWALAHGDAVGNKGQVAVARRGRLLRKKGKDVFDGLPLHRGISQQNTMTAPGETRKSLQVFNQPGPQRIEMDITD